MILGTIIARYNSRGLPGKAWRELCGKPLIEHAIEKGYASLCDELVVCTDIPRSVWSMNVPRMSKPDHLTGPEVAKFDLWRWLADQHPRAEMIVDIDVTRPLTLPEDINGCVARLSEAKGRGLEGVIAIAQADKHPAFDILESQPWGVRPYASPKVGEYTARQQLPPVYYHGGVYALSVDALRERESLWKCLVKGHEIPLERAFDIDTELDWQIVEALMAAHAVA